MCLKYREAEKGRESRGKSEGKQWHTVCIHLLILLRHERTSEDRLLRDRDVLVEKINLPCATKLFPPLKTSDIVPCRPLMALHLD